MASGYILLHRSLLTNWVWEEKRTYSRAEAWIDLIFLVNFTEGNHVINGEIRVVPRGSRYITIRELGERWKWSTTKVANFLELLEKDDMITLQKKDKEKTMLTIVNYELYQLSAKEEKTRERQEKSLNKGGNEGIEDEKNIPIPCQKILSLYHEICTSFPEIVKISSERERHIGARYKEYGCDISTFQNLFAKAQNSDFLKGKNDRKWKASFDWMINETNMAKILEGRYDNKPEPPKPPTQETIWLDAEELANRWKE